jgi:integrase
MSKVNPFHKNISQVERLLTSSTNQFINDRNLILFKMQVNYVLRAGELLALTFNDIEKGFFRQPKTDEIKYFRKLPELVEMIRQYCEKYKIKPNKPLFYSIQKKPLSYRMLQHLYETIGKKLGLHLGTHSARKTGARVMYDRTNDPRFAMQILGHSDFNTMLRYIGLTDEEFNDNSDSVGVI